MRDRKQGSVVVIKLLVTAAILYGIFAFIPFSEVAASLASARGNYFITAFLLVALPVQYFSALRMKYLSDMQEMTLSTWAILKINYVTAFYGLFLPGVLSAGGVRAYKLSRLDRKLANAIAAIAFGRIQYYLVLILLGALFFGLDVQVASGGEIGTQLVIAGFVIVMTFLLVLNRALFVFLERQVSRASFVPQALRTKIYKLTSSFTRFHSLSLRQHCYIIILCLVESLVGLAAFYLLARAVNMEVSFVSMGWVRTCMVLVLTVPVSFSGLGVREAFLIYILGFFGVPAIQALAFSALLFARTVLLGAVGGILEVSVLFDRRKEKKKVLGSL